MKMKIFIGKIFYFNCAENQYELKLRRIPYQRDHFSWLENNANENENRLTYTEERWFET
jgi:hypothetical protein